MAMAMSSVLLLDDGNTKKRIQSKRNCLSVGSWNVRTLVESTGDECVCRKRSVKACSQRDDPGLVDRKLDLLVRELKRYRVSVAGIQESKWFGSDVWPASSYILVVHC